MNLNELKDKAAAFSDKHFGKGRSPLGPLKKLDEEVKELIESIEKCEDPGDEFADCILLLIDSFRMHYGNDVDMQKLIDDCSKKLDLNETRVWELHTKDGVYRHKK